MAEPTLQAIDRSEIDALIERLDRGEVLDDDLPRIAELLRLLVCLADECASQQVSMRRLQRLLFGPSSERRGSPPAADSETPAASESSETSTSSPTASGTESAERQKRKGHGRTPSSRYTGAERVGCDDEQLAPGQPCPECKGRGRLYDTNTPSIFLRFTGQPAVSATVYERRVTRCSFCQQRFRARLPDGVEETRWEASADVALAVLKYSAGMPWYRLEHLQAAFGIPIAASTMWERCEQVADCLLPIFQLLEKSAAEADLFTVDDTRVRILDLIQENKHLSKEDRRGMFTTGLIASVGGHQITLYFSGRRHAGENLARILDARPHGLSPPITMADALSRNWPDRFTLIVAKCLVHGRRQFLDIETSFPGACARVLEDLATVFHLDSQTVGMTAEERLAFHERHSAPVLDALKAWIEEELERTEPNSTLGPALRYMVRHWQGLTEFLRTPGCPIDTNRVERALKRAVLNRKNALFYRTQHGADVGDVIMSVVETARVAGVDLWTYLVDAVRNRAAVRACPGDWLPWAWAERQRQAARVA